MVELRIQPHVQPPGCRRPNYGGTMTQITPQMATDFVHQVVPAIGRLG